MPKQPGNKEPKATGTAVFNTNKDSEFAKQLQPYTGKEKTGTAVFNTNNDTEFGKQLQPGQQPGQEKTGTAVFNTNKKD